MPETVPTQADRCGYADGGNACEWCDSIDRIQRLMRIEQGCCPDCGDPIGSPSSDDHDVCDIGGKG